jgi:hypothetical protein
MKTYILSRKTKIYLMDGRCVVLEKFTPLRLYDGTHKEIVIKVKETIILLRREKVNEEFNPTALYINGELIGFANYKNPPFPLSLLY